MNHLVVYIITIAIICAVVYVYYRNSSDNKEEYADMKFSVCRNKGYSKEYCLSRPHPGVGLTPNNHVGRIVTGS